MNGKDGMGKEGKEGRYERNWMGGKIRRWRKKGKDGGKKGMERRKEGKNE